MKNQSIKDIFKITALPVVFASLCCLSPVIFVLLGVSSVAAAASLSDLLYGTYKWVFRGIGLFTLAVALVVYFRKSKNICTLDQVKRQKNQIMNTIALALIVGVLGYVFFLYVVVHYIGAWLQLWEA